MSDSNPLRPMTPDECAIARAINARVVFVPGTHDKSFAWAMGKLAETKGAAITDAQAHYLRQVAVRYRRQLSPDVVQLALAGGATIPQGSLPAAEVFAAEPDLFSASSPRQREFNPASSAAAAEIAPRARGVREQILSFVVAAGARGCTREEIAAGMNLKENTVNPRVRELLSAEPARVREEGMRDGRSVVVSVASSKRGAA